MNYLLDEVIDLSQKLSSVLDDMDSNILRIEMEPERGVFKCLCKFSFFTDNFSIYDVVKRSSTYFPVELQIEVEGIMIATLVHWTEVHQIKSPLALACE